MQTDSTHKITISADALFQEVSGETVILDLKSEQYFGLDEIGTRIWQLLQTNDSTEQIYQTLVSEFDAEPERLQSDLSSFLDELTKAGLVSLD
jgi:hypothetical protein